MNVVGIHTYISIHLCTCMYINSYINSSIGLRTFFYKYMHTSMHTNIHTCITNIQLFVHTYMHMIIHACKALHTIHTCVHVWTHIMHPCQTYMLAYMMMIYDDIFVLLTKQSVDIPQLDYSKC